MITLERVINDWIVAAFQVDGGWDVSRRASSAARSHEWNERSEFSA
jgi:hypothetical protein